MKIFLKRIQKPIEGIYFNVNFATINQAIFNKERKDKEQEKTRKVILEAFEEVKNNPEKYGKPFKTIVPKKDWKVKTIEELIELSNDFGGHIADWVEQALEWAQRISNGEKWKDVCNEPDTISNYRIVIWKNGFVRIVGGSYKCGSKYPACDIGNYDFCLDNEIKDTVPLIVVYD